MDTYENIKFLREQRGLSQESLAHMVGYKDRSSIAKIEAGLVDLSQTKIASFAAALHVTPAQLMGIEDDQAAPLPSNLVPVSFTKIPLLGQIACGQPLLAQEHIEDYIDLPGHIHADFALTCKGDSMIDAGIQSGDMVYIRSQPAVETGQIAAVMVDGDEATLKRFYATGDTVQLVAANPKYPPMVFVGEEINTRLRVLGLAVAFTHPLLGE